MLAAIRRRLVHDDGLSLVEILVALFLLALVLMGLASTMIASLASITRDEQRVRATQLANELLEDLRIVPWDDLGFYAGDAGYQSTFDGADTVTLTGGRPSGSQAPLPGPQTVTRDGVQYTTTLNAVWYDEAGDGLAPTDADPRDAKRTHATVAWTDRGGAVRSFDSEAIRVPTVAEVPAPSGAPSPSPTASPSPSPSPTPGIQISDYTISPTIVTITTSGDTQSDINVSVTTSEPVATPTLTYNTVTVGMLEVVGSGGTQWTHIVAAGNGTFSPGDYTFNVTANGSLGSDSESKVVTFVQPVLAPVLIRTPTLTPAAPLCVTGIGGSRRLRQNVTVRFEVDGVSTGATVRVAWSRDTGSTTATATGPGSTGMLYEAVIPADHRFRDLATTVTITATRTVDSVVAQESYVYQVLSC
ncbi:MAG: prepilin-type N-terminal cleavage/methylation domain-containing protein [Actinomycetota bacterium]|nr:prepilin-type N-terminal cleavage/methylation domain-containing protein [Actinomycetota bacterium]